MAIDAVDIRIANKINDLLAKAPLDFGKGFTLTRSMILHHAWYEIKHYRDTNGANDLVSVCSEHYLYARYKSCDGLTGSLQMVALSNLYTVKIIMPKRMLNLFKSNENNDVSEYSPLHTKWEQMGISDGIFDNVS